MYKQYSLALDEQSTLYFPTWRNAVFFFAAQFRIILLSLALFRISLFNIVYMYKQILLKFHLFLRITLTSFQKCICEYHWHEKYILIFLIEQHSLHLYWQFLFNSDLKLPLIFLTWPETSVLKISAAAPNAKKFDGYKVLFNFLFSEIFHALLKSNVDSFRHRCFMQARK